jgi:hypothetical protein
MGHNIIGVPALAAETLLHYYFCVWLVDSWTWPALLLVPILLAAVTLLSWAEELFCDGLSGVYGLSLYPVLFKGSGLRVHLLGGTGCYSHPPVVLRLMAQAAAPLSMVGIIAYWFLAN